MDSNLHAPLALLASVSGYLVRTTCLLVTTWKPPVAFTVTDICTSNIVQCHLLWCHVSIMTAHTYLFVPFFVFLAAHAVWGVHQWVAWAGPHMPHVQSRGQTRGASFLWRRGNVAPPADILRNQGSHAMGEAKLEGVLWICARYVRKCTDIIVAEWRVAKRAAELKLVFHEGSQQSLFDATQGFAADMLWPVNESRSIATQIRRRSIGEAGLISNGITTSYPLELSASCMQTFCVSEQRTYPTKQTKSDDIIQEMNSLF